MGGDHYGADHLWPPDVELNVEVPSETIFGRCPRCGFIVEEAADYDCLGNEVFVCRATVHEVVVFAQGRDGAFLNGGAH